MKTEPSSTYWPTIEWREAAPQDTGMDSDTLNRMRTYIDEHLQGLHALLIVHHGYIVFEAYYHGFHQKSYHSISSATKSIISELVGVALAQSMLKSLEQHMFDFFPEYASAEKDSRKQAITIRDLLSLQTGFSKDIPNEYWRDPVRLAIQRPMEHHPGEYFHYDNQGVDILSGILSKVTGMSAAAYADATLFKSLGIWRDENAHFPWRLDSSGPHSWHGDALWDEQQGYPWKVMLQGYSTGSFGAHFTAREMAKLGYLYLHQGSWDGKQVVSPDYVTDSTRKHSEGGPPVDAQYGYLWWIEQHGNYTAFFASGYGGKLIYVVPALDLVIITTASTEQARSHPNQAKEIKDLVPLFILPATIGEKHLS